MYYSPHTSPPSHDMFRSGVLDVLFESIQALVTLLGPVVVMCLMMAAEVRASYARGGAVNGSQGGINLLQGPPIP